ncbi:hypothetical protein [Acrocarpospora sp. B8E8]|uniref:hypothetical protein n=1 Tax=Acrocarpospora sp. B8E8 TaxID=3153572 RepID=UPI00325EA6A5
MSLESADVRDYDKLVKRHMEQVAQIAAHIAEYSGYLTVNPADDQVAQTIERDVAELRRRVAIVSELGELRHIFHPGS